MEEKRKKEDDRDDFWDIPDLLPRRNTPAPRGPDATSPVDITLEPAAGAKGESPEAYPVVDPRPHRLSVPLPSSRGGGGRTGGDGSPESSGSPAVGQDQVIHSGREGGAPASNDGGSAVLRRFIPPHTAQEFANPPVPDDEYSPEHPLIHHVSIYNRKTSYNYYEQFLRHARRVGGIAGVESPHVPYFSYVPQFSQLDRAQLAWYLWWRQRVAAGDFIKTDYSYILLFIYEIINTGGHGNPAWGQRMLACLWREGRADYSRLDRLLGEWLCDFSLIHRLPLPHDLIEGIPAEALGACTLKEFYMASGRNFPDAFCKMLITYCSNYDYRRSKFATGDALPLYDKHIRGALAETVRCFSAEGGHLLGRAGLEDSRVVREAFAGALCSFEIKKKLEIDYCSFSRTHELRFLVSDIIKYSENKLRALLGIKSRLGVYALPLPIRECVDRYFAALAPRKRTDDTRRSEEPGYEKRYDIPATPASPQRAAEIERLSWETTERLVSAFGDTGGIRSGPDAGPTPSKSELGAGLTPSKSEADAILTPSKSEPYAVFTPSKSGPDWDPFRAPDITGAPLPAAGGQTGNLAEALGPLFEFAALCAALDIAGQRDFARRRGEPPELIADTVNAIAADAVGDIILEEREGGYALIEDYRELLPGI